MFQEDVFQKLERSWINMKRFVKDFISRGLIAAAFVPLPPNKSTGDVLAWRKNTVLSPAIKKFLQFVNEEIQES